MVSDHSVLANNTEVIVHLEVRQCLMLPAPIKISDNCYVRASLSTKLKIDVKNVILKDRAPYLN